MNLETKTIRIDVDPNMPVGNCGDGISVNKKAAKVLQDFYGFSSPGDLSIFIYQMSTRSFIVEKIKY